MDQPNNQLFISNNVTKLFGLNILEKINKTKQFLCENCIIINNLTHNNKNNMKTRI